MDDKEYIIDREYTPFIFNAIIGIKSSEWSQLYSVENFHIYFNKTVHSVDGLKYYTITFFLTRFLQIIGWKWVMEELMLKKLMSIWILSLKKLFVFMVGGK